MGITEDIRNYLIDNYGDEVTFAEIAPNSTDSQLKAFETMALFRDVIIPSLGAKERMIIGKRRYIAVIDSKEKPTDAYQDVLAEISGTQDNISEYKKSIFIWLTDSLAVYRRELDGKKLFYDYTDVWYEYEFDNKIKKL